MIGTVEHLPRHSANSQYQSFLELEPALWKAARLANVVEYLVAGRIAGDLPEDDRQEMMECLTGELRRTLAAACKFYAA